jgi:hypothetical protein
MISSKSCSNDTSNRHCFPVIFSDNRPEGNEIRLSLAASARLHAFTMFPGLCFHRPTRRYRSAYRMMSPIFANRNLHSTCRIRTGLLVAYRFFHGEVFLPADPEGQPFSLSTSLTTIFNRRPCFIRVPLALGSLVRFQFRRWANPTSVLRLELVEKVPKNFSFSLIFKDA